MTPTTHAADRASAIAAILESNIASGHYRPGDRLPSEADLCTHFQVSRPTLREALGRLAAVGLLVSRRGSGGGSFVARPDTGLIGARIAALVGLVATQDAESAGSLTTARIHAEIGCAHLAALARADITDLRAEIDLQSDFGLPAETFAASCRRLHLSICAASGNASLALVGQALVEAEFANPAAIAFETRERARFLSCHVRVANGIAGGRPEDCRAALLDLVTFDTERRGPPQGGGAEPERPPRMRDLRLPRVQRLSPEGGEG
jgi:GntR family transcriptional regulator, transcriptional repressor for pyruvate dehydrogenase complex